MVRGDRPGVHRARARARRPAAAPGGDARSAGSRNRTSTAGARRWPGSSAPGVYGGYFGAAQGILLLAALGLTVDEDLQRINALKNVLAGIVNGVAAIVFIVAADVAWGPAALIAGGSIAGGQIGARYGRRLPPARRCGRVIVVVGLTAIVVLLAS